MTRFELVVVFSGLLAFVKHKSKNQHRVVIPATMRADPRVAEAMDEFPLYPHYPHIRIGDSVRPIFSRGKIFLDPAPVGHLNGTPQNLADMGSFMNHDCSISQAAVDHLRGVTVCHLDIASGNFVAPKPDEVRNWQIDARRLQGADRSESLARAVRWEIFFEESQVNIKLEPATGGSPEVIASLDLNVTQEVAINNFRGEDIWHPQAPPPSGQRPDHDFRWYYELLEGYEHDPTTPLGWVNNRVDRNNPLPIPEPPPQSPNPAMTLQGFTHNCMLCRFPEAEWS